jgi:CheY-like chemotaxis protein
VELTKTEIIPSDDPDTSCDAHEPNVKNTKADFLSMMSHEIRSPLTGVLGMAELLADTELTPEQRDFVDTIHSAGQALLSIINDVLDFSKIEAGKLKLDVIDFDLRTTVEEVIKLLAAKAHKKDLELACLMPADLPQTLCGDPGRIRQILMNLIDNAVKFTPRGDVLVRAIVENETIDHIHIRLEVIDTGIGISPEARAQLFQPFSQADGSITRQYGGTGLGLAICKRLVDLMGGQIGIDSEIGHGSNFWFTVQFGKQITGTPRELPLRVDLQGLRALVVARSTTMSGVLEHHLRHWGIQATCVNDGSTVLACLKAAVARGEPCDLALFDMPTPNVDAFELARLVKADPLLADTRLVLLTSLGHRGQAREAQEAGFAAYLTKPVRQAQLYGCFVTVMGVPMASHGQGLNHLGPSTKLPLVTKYTLKEAQARARSQVLLVVEDRIVDQKVAVRMLEKLGYRADIATTGREALEVLANPHVHYAAVLMDWKMPGMDGLEVAAEIRRREGAKQHVPIVAMTIKGTEKDREQCLKAGMDDHISKPMTLDQLDKVIRRCGAESSGPHVGSKVRVRQYHSEQ